jgi:hypothetical protein
MDSEQTARTARSPSWHLALVVVALVVIAAFAFGGWQAYKAPRGSAVINALTQLLHDIPDDEKQTKLIGQVILENFIEYRSNTRNWSFVYFGCLFLSAAFAAVAGAGLKLEYLMEHEGFKKDLAALLAMTSALLVTLATTGNFQQKWSANRLAAAKMEKVAYDFMTTTDRKANLPRISAQIQDISFERNAEIVSNDHAESRKIDK